MNSTIPILDDIPYEIWLYIASFLSKDELWALYGLNKILDDIAIDNRFRRVAISLNDAASKKYRRRFSDFRCDNEYLNLCHRANLKGNPNSDYKIATRVLKLSFSPQISTDFPNTSKKTQNIKKLLQIIRNYVQRDRNLVIKTIQGFTNVRHVDIRFGHLRDTIFRESIPLLHASLLPSSDQLRSLHFSFPSELMRVVLPRRLFLPNLNSFTMSLFTLPGHMPADKVFSDAVTKTLVPFLNRHRLTLINLSLTLKPMDLTWGLIRQSIRTNFNLFPLFEYLDHSPGVQRLCISISEPTPSNYIFRFLKSHSHTLRHLTITMPDFMIISTGGVLDQFEAPFPRLQSFRIQYHDDWFNHLPSVHQEATWKFVRQHASSLDSLTMIKSPTSSAQFLTFLDPLVSHSKPKYLKMGLQTLTAEMMDVFATSLLDLQELDLVIHYFKRSQTSPLNVLEENEASGPSNV